MRTYTSAGYIVQLFRPQESPRRHTQYWQGLRGAYARHGLGDMASYDFLSDLVVLGSTLDGRRVGGLRVDVVTPERLSFARFWQPTTESLVAEPRGAWSDERAFSPVLARAFHHAIHMLGFDHAWFAAHHRGVGLWERIGSVVPLPAVEYPEGYKTWLVRMDWGYVHPEHQAEFETETEQLEAAA